MKVTITDPVTSMKILKELPQDHAFYMGADFGNNESKYGWAFRIDHHTPEELADGHSQNPQLIIIPMEEFCELVGVKIEPQDAGKTFVSFPKENGISMFLRMDYCPAYEVIPEGIEGKLIEVEIDLD